jgi:glucose-6-phosphate isomerase
MNENTLEYIKGQIDELEIFRVLKEDHGYIRQAARKFDKCEKIIVIGTGGSSLGAKAIIAFDSCYKGQDPRVVFVENTDSRNFMNIIRKCDPNSTGVIVISKSGRTTETLTLFLTLCEIWPDFDYKNRALAITEISDRNDIRILSETRQMQILPHNPKIGGRFSVFSVVGLLPILLAGVNIESFVNGAKRVIEQIKNLRAVEGSKLLVDAITMYSIFKDNTVNQHVLMIYSDMLHDFGKWFVQLVGESLGKTEDFGITPLLATGTIDQHSLLQLFLGGPKNKLYTIIVQKENLATPCITETTDSAVINKLRGKTIHDLMRANQEYTIEALSKRALVRVIEADAFSVEALGDMMMSCIFEVLTLAHLSGVNPFDQPAVDAAKTLLMEKLSDMVQNQDNRKAINF